MYNHLNETQESKPSFSHYSGNSHTDLVFSTASQKIDLFFNQYKPISYKKRSLILHGEDSLNNVFYIKSGYVRAYKISEQGEELTMLILKPNDIFPLTSGTNQVQNNYYLEAINPVEIWRLPKEQFSTFIDQNLDVLQELTGRMLTRLNGVLTRMEHLVFGTAYTKVASILLICAKQFGEITDKGTIIHLPLTHKDIATLVGITRETACLEMKKLEKKGLISHLGRLTMIQNIHSLEEESLMVDQTAFSYSNFL